MKHILLPTIVFISLQLHAQYPVFDWAMQAGIGGAGESGNCIIVDETGNTYTTGDFRGNCDFDPGPGITTLISNGYDDAFVVKLNNSGELLWAFNIGDSAYDHGGTIIQDHSGNLYITGTFQDTVDFDPGPGMYELASAGGSDIYILKIDPDGNMIWAKSLSGYDWANNYDITVDLSNHIYLSGSFNDTVDFDPGPDIYELISDGGENAYVAKFTTDGNLIWAKGFGNDGYGDHKARSITIDDNSNVYITGEFYETTDFDPGPSTYDLTSVDYRDIYISSLDSAGNFRWAISFGGDGFAGDFGTAIIANSGTIYVIGDFDETVDFDPGPDTVELNSAYGDLFIVHYDTSGNFIWAKQIGSDNVASSALITDLTGGIYISGSFNGFTGDFDPGPEEFLVSSLQSHNIFIAKYTPGFDLIWVIHMGGESFVYGSSVDADHSGNVYLTGDFYASTDFDPGPGEYLLTPAGISGADLFIEKLNYCFYSEQSIIIDACSNYISPSGNIWTVSGIYEDTILNIAGCDSIITIDLTISPDTSVLVFEETLTANASDAVYQWIDCITMLPIDGATDQSFTPLTVGSYAVIVTQNGCTDTSACYNINKTGIDEDHVNQLTVFPNPTTGLIHIIGMNPTDELRLFDITGRMVPEANFQLASPSQLIILSPPGCYIIEIKTTSGVINRLQIIKH